MGASNIALDKRESLMIIQDNCSYFSMKPYTCIVTPHLNCLVKTVQMRDQNVCF